MNFRDAEAAEFSNQVNSNSPLGPWLSPCYCQINIHQLDYYSKTVGELLSCLERGEAWRRLRCAFVPCLFLVACERVTLKTNWLLKVAFLWQTATFWVTYQTAHEHHVAFFTVTLWAGPSGFIGYSYTVPSNVRHFLNRWQCQSTLTSLQALLQITESCHKWCCTQKK